MAGFAATLLVASVLVLTDIVPVAAAEPSGRDEVDLEVDLSGNDFTWPGTTEMYGLAVSNLGEHAAEGAVLTVTIGDNLTFVEADAGGTYDPVQRTVTWTDLEVAPASDPASLVGFAIVVKVTDSMPAGQTRVTSRADVSSADDVDPSNNSDTQTALVLSDVNLSITADAGQTRVVPGQALTYDLTASNLGTHDVSGVRVTDWLDRNVEFVSATAGGVYDPRTRAVTWDLGDFKAGAAKVEMRLDVRVSSALSPPDSFRVFNVASIDDDHTSGVDMDLSDNRAVDADFTGADLAVTKSLDGGRLIPGAMASYTISVTNTGPMTVTDLLVDETMPTMVTLVDATVSRGRLDTDNWSWSGVDLAAGESATLTVTVDVSLDATGDLTNTVTVTGVGVGDPDLSNNASTVSSQVVPEVDLSLTNTLNGTLTRSSDADWTLVVTNDGPSRATGVTVTDTMPPGVRFAGATGARWSCANPDRQTVTCTLGEVMEPFATVELVITTTTDADAPVGPVTNRAEVSAAEAERTGANNAAVASGSIEAVPATPGPVVPAVPTATPATPVPPAGATGMPGVGAQASAPTRAGVAGERAPAAEAWTPSSGAQVATALPRTGSDPLPLLASGLLLAAVGAAALVLRRRLDA